MEHLNKSEVQKIAQTIETETKIVTMGMESTKELSLYEKKVRNMAIMVACKLLTLKEGIEKVRVMNFSLSDFMDDDKYKDLFDK